MNSTSQKSISSDAATTSAEAVGNLSPVAASTVPPEITSLEAKGQPTTSSKTVAQILPGSARTVQELQKDDPSTKLSSFSSADKVWLD